MAFEDGSYSAQDSGGADTPAPLSADSLRDRLYTDLENSFMSFLRSDPTRTTTVPATLAAQQFQYRIEALIATALQSERQRIADSLLKAIESVEIDVEATRKHMESKGATENDILNMEIEADDRKDVLHDALEAVRAVLIPPTQGDQAYQENR